MSTKTYWLQFGTGDPRPYSGLSPTFLQFFDNTGQTLLAPAIAEIKYGGATATGAYGFSYLISSTQSVYFLAFSVTLLANANDRYVSGVIDPILAIDQNVNGLGTTLVATGSTIVGIGASNLALGSTILGIGNTLIAEGSTVLAISSSMASIGNTLLGIGNTLLSIGQTFVVTVAGIGSTASSYGSTSVDPGTVFGYLKRIQEFLEGDNTFTSANGQWLIYNRASLGTTTLLRQKTVVNTGATANKTGL